MNKVTTVKDFMLACGFRGRQVQGHCFSMWLCFASDLGWKSEDFDNWAEKDLLKQYRRMYNDSGISPLLLYVSRELRDSD